MSIEEDTIRELLIQHVISQGFYRPQAEQKVARDQALLAAAVAEVDATETELDSQ